MTLRMTLEIVPFGVEENKHEIYHIDMNNTGVIEDKGFGHVVCSYEYFLKKPIPPILMTQGGPTHEIEGQGVVPSHDRRDGALALLQGVLNGMLGEVG